LAENAETTIVNPDGITTPTSIVCLLLALAATLFLVVPGLHWGLPSETRNRLELGADRESWQAPEEIESPWSEYPNALPNAPERTGSHPRNAFNPIRSYHPDEYAIFKSLSGMQPSRLRFFHGFFGWPAFHFYVVGGALQASAKIGIVKLMPKMAFYYANPDELGRMYVVGRVITLLMALGCIIVLWRAATRLFGRGGGAAAALLLAVTPLFAINAHYMTADVPMLFWMSLALLASTHVLKGGPMRWSVLAGVFIGLAAGTRYQGVIAAFPVVAAHLLKAPDETEANACEPCLWKRLVARLFSRELLIAGAISIGVFLATNPYILARPGQFYREFTGELHSSRNPMAFLTSVLLFAQCGLGAMLSIATVLSLLLAGLRRDRKVGFILLAFGVPALLLAMGRPVMVRYMMPVIFLPPLLIAWAFGVILRRGAEINKRMSRAAAPLLLLAILVMTGLQSQSFCAMFVRPEMDTRTRAGEWIAASIPDGATVGVVSVPWQFELPPLNAKRLNIVVVKQDPAALARAAPDYFIASDLQFPPVSVRGPLNDSERAFHAEVFEGKGAYRVRQGFSAWPYGYANVLRYGPHDMRYANPRIVIAQRRLSRPGFPGDNGL